MARPDQIDADALLVGARNGSEPFAAFYRHLERPLLGFFIRATGQAELAADLAAETFASALESIDSFDPAKGRADQWLFGIARNVLGKSYRRGRVDASARQRLSMPALVLGEDVLDAIGRVTIEEEATLALAELPPEQRHAIEARVLGEREYAAIAGELRCSEAVVRQRVSRGLRALRTRLAGDP